MKCPRCGTYERRPNDVPDVKGLCLNCRCRRCGNDARDGDSRYCHGCRMVLDSEAASERHWRHAAESPRHKSKPEGV